MVVSTILDMGSLKAKTTIKKKIKNKRHDLSREEDINKASEELKAGTGGWYDQNTLFPSKILKEKINKTGKDKVKQTSPQDKFIHYIFL